MNEKVDKIIGLLLKEKKNYEQTEFTDVFDRLIKNFKKLKVKIEDELLEQIDEDLNDLDRKCYDLCEVVNSYSCIRGDLKSILRQNYVKELREKNRKKRMTKNG